MPRYWTISVPSGWVEDTELGAAIRAEKMQESHGAAIDVAAYVPADKGPGAMAVIQITVDYPPNALAELERGAHEATVAGGNSVEYTSSFSDAQLVANDIADQAQGRVWSKRVFFSDGKKVTWVSAQCVAKHGATPPCAEAVKTLAATAPGVEHVPVAAQYGVIGGTLILTIVAIAMIAKTRESRAASPAPSRHPEP